MGVLPGNEGVRYLVVTLENDTFFFSELFDLLMVVWGLTFLVEDFLEGGQVGLSPLDVMKSGS
jgi:hypothetical protein